MQIDYGKRIFGLDLMRAVAIILVVLSHILWITPNAVGLVADLLSLAGVIGVEIFFVLSGFLIGRIIYNFYVREDFEFKNVMHFWLRRWFRTLPNYYLVLILNIVVALYLGTQLPSNLWNYFLFTQNFAWEMPLFFSESWSLPIEEFAYIIGPLLLYLILFLKLKISRSKLFGIITFAIILLFFITKIIYNQFHVSTDMNFWNVNLKAITIYRIDAIYYGVFASYLYMKRPHFWKRFKWGLFLIAVLMFVGLNMIIPLKRIFIDTHPFFWNVLYLPINSIAIAFTLPLLSEMKTAPKFILKPLTYISVISYSMYLLHYSIILQLMKYFLPTENLPRFDQSVYISVYLALTILASYFLYRVYEKPMMDLRDRPFVINRFS